MASKRKIGLLSGGKFYVSHHAVNEIDRVRKDCAVERRRERITDHGVDQPEFCGVQASNVLRGQPQRDLATILLSRIPILLNRTIQSADVTSDDRGYQALASGRQ